MSKTTLVIEDSCTVEELITLLSNYKGDDTVSINVEGKYDYLKTEVLVNNDIVMRTDYGCWGYSD